MAFGEGRDDHVIDVQVVKADGGGNDVDDGVHGAHLVEVDLFDGDAVSLGFRLGYDVKDSVRELAGTGREGTCIDDGCDLLWSAVFVVVMVGMTVDMVMHVIMVMIMFVIMMVAMLLVVVMVVIVPMVVLVMVVMLMLVLVMVVLVTVFVESSVEPLHVVVVSIDFLVEHHVKVTDVTG